jgi:rfaE bifunctional protein nucleotidyltransferase chain/domain
MNIKKPISNKVFVDMAHFLGSNPKKKRNETIVFTNGCFDIVHIGHLDYLEKASRKGNYLIVGINSDASVKRLKGVKRPINTWEHRAYHIASLSYIDAVICFEEDTPLHLITELKPDVLVKGGDYEIHNIVGAEWILDRGGRVETIDFVHDISTTDIITKLKS